MPITQNSRLNFGELEEFLKTGRELGFEDTDSISINDGLLQASMTVAIGSAKDLQTRGLKEKIEDAS